MVIEKDTIREAKNALNTIGYYTRKVAIVGSTSYYDKMLKHKIDLEREGYKVRLPILDYAFHKELDIIEANRDNIAWANEVHMFYDGRSLGTLVDFGMTVMAQKPLKIIYLNNKTIINAMKQYEEE